MFLRQLSAHILNSGDCCFIGQNNTYVRRFLLIFIGTTDSSQVCVVAAWVVLSTAVAADQKAWTALSFLAIWRVNLRPDIQLGAL